MAVRVGPVAPAVPVSAVRVLASPVLGILVLGCMVGGCRRADAPGAPSAPSASNPPAPPVDRLRPGELGAGALDAFGLVLPRGMRVQQRLERAVYASGQLSPASVAVYVRERVTAAGVELAGNRTVFSHARIHGGRPDREYEIVVIRDEGRCRLEVRDVTRDPSPRDLTVEERWRRAGLSTDGRVLDPNRLR